MYIGIGEYVKAPDNYSQHFNSTEEIEDFTISSNAIIVNRASPQALANAAFYLITHPDVSRSIGKAGRQTVLSYFTIERQMKQYSQLYQYIHHHHRYAILDNKSKL